LDRGKKSIKIPAGFELLLFTLKKACRMLTHNNFEQKFREGKKKTVTKVPEQATKLYHDSRTHARTFMTL